MESLSPSGAPTPGQSAKHSPAEGTRTGCKDQVMAAWALQTLLDVPYGCCAVKGTLRVISTPNLCHRFWVGQPCPHCASTLLTDG